MIAECEKQQKQIYIVISQTGTILSRILKVITGAKYNHVSLGLNEDLETLYSFGRKNPYNPFYAGFVVESPNFGTFKRFKNTEVLVYSLNVGEEKRIEISDYILDISTNRKSYHYNYFGLFSAMFKIAIRPKNSFYCSEFVREVLQHSGITGADKMPGIVQPIHFLDIPSLDLIYKGKLSDYTIN